MNVIQPDRSRQRRRGLRARDMPETVFDLSVLALEFQTRVATKITIVATTPTTQAKVRTTGMPAI